MLLQNSFLTAFEMPLGKAALIALLGIAIVFVVLAMLVGILTLFKLVFNIKIGKKADAPAPAAADSATEADESEDEIVAVVMAAIAAMGDEQTATAPFRIKSIRKLK